ncbi:hypothetical protein DYB37_008726 [Aphanomyces astaci]|uniref:Uncharacterized protein n=1 Tax=Aphanomyces astaci TaxID=112090 RepID=A0A397BBQ9_APHAT|nr:hypothetical protein DYB36_009355 [Aphanomyces astaci]RHY25313.1 hypothetical protein DYB25_008556 [Aphanomyces astaci]RHY36917.1 hypothetical protein DYB34_000943 [Aphanomyces astaci]RHY54316.1 hypothetical protein DYB38_011529 [Aphanomyces astaci]RHY69164.1 hypothetical protein DYB30_008257 [Aphanomyces astaci]
MSTKDKEYFKSWYTKNKEKVIARVKVYNATHREAQNARMQQWREKNRAKIAAYREVNREQRRQYKRDHYRRAKERRQLQATAMQSCDQPAVTDTACPRMKLSFLLHPQPQQPPPPTSFAVSSLLTTTIDYDAYIEV